MVTSYVPDMCFASSPPFSDLNETEGGLATGVGPFFHTSSVGVFPGAVHKRRVSTERGVETGYNRSKVILVPLFRLRSFFRTGFGTGTEQTAV